MTGHPTRASATGRSPRRGVSCALPRMTGRNHRPCRHRAYRPRPPRPRLSARRDPAVGPVARLLRDRDHPQPGLRQYLRGGRRARRLQRRVPHPGDRPRRPGRGRADRPVRADLQPAPPRRRRRAGERLRSDRADRRGRPDDDRQHRHLHRRTVAGGRHRRRVRSGDPGSVRPAPAHQLSRAGDVRGVDRARRGPRRAPAVPVLCPRADPLHDGHHRGDGPVRRPLRDRGIGLGRGRRRGGAPGDPGDRHDAGRRSGSARPSRSGPRPFASSCA